LHKFNSLREAASIFVEAVGRPKREFPADRVGAASTDTAIVSGAAACWRKSRGWETVKGGVADRI
jgi:hypothetical protein